MSRTGITSCGRRAGGAMVMLLALVLLSTACTSVTGGDARAPKSVTTSPAPRSVPTMLVVDFSESMRTADAPGPRVDAAREAVGSLLEELPSDAQLGLMVYGSSVAVTPQNLVPGCRDITVLRELGPLDRSATALSLSSIAALGFTPIGNALRAAADALPATEPAAIVFVSDGEDTCGPPPCDVAAEISSTHPQLSISTIGFKTDSDQLECVAAATGGLFVTADNAEQLSARLLATQDPDIARTRLSPQGVDGIELGSTAEAIRDRHSDFPSLSSANAAADGTVTIAWGGCTFVFGADGRLSSIAIVPGAQTIDGLRIGDALARADDLYGDAVSTEGSTNLYTADAVSGTAWRITHDGAAITAIGLCECLPATPSKPAGTEVIDIRPYQADGTLTPEYAATAITGPKQWGCRSAASSFGDPGLFTCGQYQTDYIIYMCSFAGGRSLCPDSKTSPEALRFLSNPATQNPASSSDTPIPAPHPLAVQIADGTVCWYGIRFGGRETDGTRVMYLCGQNNYLFAPNGRSALDTSSPTWTASYGPGGQKTTVDVTKVWNIESARR
ncbi:VWA domain-containing protein [Williamsia sp. 1135]|uniref:vWA domain-containing protein n=1 Tax=Williamsia sp. 1135 TaxID=1889262 RepID=UPI00143ACBBE|nr:VWA domain-containing protein [Williamsia sp. 1135]